MMSKKPAELLDECLWALYTPSKPKLKRFFSLGGNELPMLAKLFRSPLFGPALQAAASQCAHGKARLSLAWVDKRPVAAVAGVRRTEYGDLAIFRIHGYRKSDGCADFNSRCLLIQAKIAKEKNQIANPCVPINPTKPRTGSSTEREFNLLSNWPEHDMYEYGASGTPIATKLNVPNACAWYMATPRKPISPPATSWRSPWMCAPVAKGAKCDVTLGELMAAFLSNTSVTRPSTYSQEIVGAGFHLNIGEFHKSAAPTSVGWDRICMEILRGMRGFNLPKFLTGGTATSGIKTIKLYASPIEPLYEMAVRGWEYLRRHFGHSKMLVVVVSSYTDG